MDVTECLNLIRLVRENPCIWDRSHQLHNNSEHVKGIWTKIAEELNHPLKKTRTKWKNLRDSYRLQLYKQIDALENNNETNLEASSWPFYNEMSFLQDHMYRKTVSKSATKFDNEDITDPDDGDNHSSNDSMRHIEMVTADEFDSSVLDYLNQSQSDPSHNARKKTSIVVHANRSSLEIAEDEDRCFFDSLLPYMKLLSPKDKMLCRMRIQEVIFSLAFPAGKNVNSCEPGTNDVLK